jgi:peptidoglycan hydrolase-like protein with peptidoglycan-binding domain
VAAALVSAGGVSGALLVRSPAQQAADMAPPTPSVLTSPVVSQVLTNTVVLRGDFGSGRVLSAIPTSVAATRGAYGRLNHGTTALVVTGVFVRPGDPLPAGQPLASVSGRPVFALPGAVPAYRDLGLGDTGGDVAQLQAALTGLGHPCGGDPAGTFGPGTANAVTALYSAMRYPVPLGDGPMVPASEVLFVPHLPARVSSVPVHVGDPVHGTPVVSVVTGGLDLVGYLDQTNGAQVRQGMPVRITAESLGISATGRVASVGTLVTPGDHDRSGTDPANGGLPYLPLTVTPSAPWDPRLANTNVRITITSAATAAPVLSVPSAAIVSGTDASTSVTVLAGGARRTVHVTTGLQVNGMVQVSPTDGDRLRAGDQVVVGP